MPMRTKASTGKIRQTYEFIKANRNRFDVRTMRRVLEVAPSGRVVDATDDSPRARTRRSVDGRTPWSPTQNCYMSRRGNCWDNAVAESFFSSLKKERIKKKIYRTRELAQAEISDYIDSFYNPTRRHSHLGGVSHEEFERAGRRRRRVH